MIDMLMMTILAYCFINYFGKHVGSQYSNSKNEIYFCRFCLHGFYRKYATQHSRTNKEMKEKLKDNEGNCFSFAAQRTEFPVNPIVKFNNIKKHLPAPFVV